MAKVVETATETEVPDEFPVTIEEFISELPTSQVGARAAFRYAAAGLTGKQQRAAWNVLYTAFMQAPVGTKISDL